MKYKAIIFDLDGTLLDTLDDLADAGNTVLAKAGLPVHSTDSYRYFVGDGLISLIQRVLPEDPMGLWMYNAPVVLFIHIHRDLNEWALFDIGLFAQSVLLASKNAGVDTVPQARMGNNNEEVAALLGLGSERRIIMGITMGYGDKDHPNNQYRSPRQDIDAWTTWHSS